LIVPVALKADLDTIVGKSEVYKDYANRRLVAKVNFKPPELNPLAEKIFKKILNRSLKEASCGLLPLEIPPGLYGKNDNTRGEKNETYYYGSRELLEWSIVNVPSNADAMLIRSLEKLEPAITYKKKDITAIRKQLVLQISQWP
jgi:hypothetical protein